MMYVNQSLSWFSNIQNATQGYMILIHQDLENLTRIMQKTEF